LDDHAEGSDTRLAVALAIVAVVLLIESTFFWLVRDVALVMTTPVIPLSGLFILDFPWSVRSWGSWWSPASLFPVRLIVIALIIALSGSVVPIACAHVV
jgi:hypothetical protein